MTKTFRKTPTKKEVEERQDMPLLTKPRRIRLNEIQEEEAWEDWLERGRDRPEDGRL